MRGAPGTTEEQGRLGVTYIRHRKTPCAPRCELSFSAAGAKVGPLREQNDCVLKSSGHAQ